MSAASSVETKVEWSEAERVAWEWPERLKPSEWCERAPIHIPDNAINPEPGPYSFNRTPYLREILDCAVDPVVREVWFYKPTQVGGSRSIVVNLPCYFADQDPGACGILFPDEDTVDEFFAEELKPTIDETPAMRRHKSGRAWDNTTDEIWLDSMPIFGLYAGSVQKLARRSLRYVIGDEINKYRPFKNEASPILLLKKRTSNWLHRARAFFLSTPTTRDGNITVGYESCPDKREYWCKCPHCGEYEVWVWSQVKGFKDSPGANKFEKANAVRMNQPAYYECSHNKCRIKTEAEKTSAVAAGRWASQGQTVNRDGELVGTREPSAKVGFHLTSMVSPWLTFSDLAAEFIEAEGDPDKSRDFRNARLALPWDEVVKTVRPSAVRDKQALAGPQLVVPKWCTYLIATADTQKDWFAFAIRAWGWGDKSALVHYGECRTFEELYRIGLQSQFAGENGEMWPHPPQFLLIDSGGTKDDGAEVGRTNEVYQFAMGDQRIIPIKGDSRMAKPWSRTVLPNGVTLIRHIPGYYKDMLARLIADPDPTKWLPHNSIPEQYCLEMSSQHKIVDPKTRKTVWANTGTARREAWDIERLQCLAADMFNLSAPPPAEPPPQTPTQPSQRPAWMPERPSNWLNR